MLIGYSSLVQTLLGTGLTWGVTAFGALFCAFQPFSQHSNSHLYLLDASLGFSTGVMLAASYWSLLEPAISASVDDLGLKHLAVLPPLIGLLLGAMFVALADHFLPVQWFDTVELEENTINVSSYLATTIVYPSNERFAVSSTEGLRHRNVPSAIPELLSAPVPTVPHQRMTRRLWLLLLAVTLHNIPEGLAVGVAFGGVGAYPKATFNSARTLAIGIAIQNFPEGLAVSLPLRASGYGFWKSFWYGQLSGFVEVISGLVGCAAVQIVRQLQPYALGFAAGAMIFVVVDDVIPEAHTRGNGRLASFCTILGFALLMVLEVILAPE